MDYRVIRQWIIPLGIQEHGQNWLLPAHSALLDVISPRTGDKNDQRQVFQIFFNLGRLWNNLDDVMRHQSASIFVQTDGIGASLSLTRLYDHQYNTSRESFLDDARKPQPRRTNWNNFHRGICFLDAGIDNLQLDQEHVIGVDPGNIES